MANSAGSGHEHRNDVILAINVLPGTALPGTALPDDIGILFVG